MSRNTQWLSCYKTNPYAKLRLFCFPFAGGGSSIFRTWSQDLPNWIEVCPVQLPGRENRISEKPFDKMDPLVAFVAAGLKPYLDMPFVFFGHSMGSFIAYELACYLREKYNLLPEYLFVSGRFAPHVPDPDNFHLLEEKEFKEKLKEYNGTPNAVLENEEIMQLLLPLLRADFSICETYIHKSREPLACPISAFGGKNDSTVKKDDLNGWENYTKNKFRTEMFDGDHFFLRIYQKELTFSIVKDLLTNGF